VVNTVIYIDRQRKREKEGREKRREDESRRIPVAQSIAALSHWCWRRQLRRVRGAETGVGRETRETLADAVLLLHTTS